MGKQWNWLLVLCLLLLCLMGLVSAQDDLSLECQDNSCRIAANNVIEVKAGTTLQLKLTAPKTGFLQFSFDSHVVVNVMFQKAGLDKGADSRFSLLDQKLAVNTISFVLNFTNSNLTRDNNKLFKYTLQNGGKKTTGNFSLYIIDPPKLCGNKNAKTEYNVNERGNQTIPMTLCGNPAPQVQAFIDSKKLSVSSRKDAMYQYTFFTSLKEVTRKHCGKSVTLKVVNSTIKRSYKLKVQFIPDKVENISAKLDYVNCLTVTWKRVPSGNCPLKYELRYTVNGTSKSNIIDGLKWRVCNSSINNTVNVRAVYNGDSVVSGAYNDEAVVPVTPPPIPTTVITTTLSRVTARTEPSIQSSPMTWKVILAIVVGVIALILIIAVVFIASRKKEKSKGENNNGIEITGPLPHVEESDYAEVNSFATTLPSKEPNDENLVYAELGPGGGRTGPKPKPEESNYATVKTEGLYYPPLQQSFREEPKKAFYEPPRYSVASRGKKDPAEQPLAADDGEDYIEDIVV